MGKKTSSLENSDALARFIAPKLFADEAAVLVPQAIRDRWNALVEADHSAEVSGLDVCVLILRRMKENIICEEGLMAEVKVSFGEETAERHFVPAIEKLLEEGMIEDAVRFRNAAGTIQNPRVFRILERGVVRGAPPSPETK